MPNRGGGSGGGLAKDQTFSGFCFVHPSLRFFLYYINCPMIYVLQHPNGKTKTPF